MVNAISFLLLREAIFAIDMGGGPLMRAAFAAAAMNLSGVLMVGAWLLATDRPGLVQIGRHLRLGVFVGSASALGTIFWYIASALTNASYVAAVAQVQIVFVLAISRYWFRETIRPLELAGMAIILAGVLLFRLA